MRIRFEPLNSACHNRDDFDCGSKELNAFIKEQANQRQKKHNAVTHVAVDIDMNELLKTIYGYYTLSNFSVEYCLLPSLEAKKASPKEVVPALKLGRLARNKLCTSKGFGEIILIEAFRKAIQLSEETGMYLIEVDLLNPALHQFYEKYEFQKYKDDKQHMFIAMETVIKLVSERNN